jgi:hypothetical protein
MNKAETLKRDIDLLPPSLLVEVEYFVNKLKRQSTTAKKPTTLLSELADNAIEDDLPADLAEQHDHYLYGVLIKRWRKQ